tara:strand:+ start:603 stop:872 length:270 start_codon:yes stop_codon:yes gene_type:complete
MDEPAFIFGRIVGYCLVLFWCYAAIVTGNFIGTAIRAPFEKEPKKEPKKQQDPVPEQAKKPKKAGKFVYPVIEDYKDEHKITHPFESSD